MMLGSYHANPYILSTTVLSDDINSKADVESEEDEFTREYWNMDILIMYKSLIVTYNYKHLYFSWEFLQAL